MHEERREVGRQAWRDVTGWDAPEAVDLWTEKTIDFVMGEVWNRPGLSRKERRWITLTAVCASGAAAPMRAHLRAALQSGDCTLAELDEFVLHAAVYLGWPTTAPLGPMIREIAAELD